MKGRVLIGGCGGKGQGHAFGLGVGERSPHRRCRHSAIHQIREGKVKRARNVPGLRFTAQSRCTAEVCAALRVIACGYTNYTKL